MGSNQERGRELTPEELNQYKRDGYLVIENFLTATECEALRTRCGELIDEMDLSSHPMSVFSTTHQKNDDYFMTSGDKIRFFLEEGVIDEKGHLDREKHLAINKMGHGLHMLDSLYKKITFSRRIQDIFRSIGFQEPKIPQSMYIFKQPYVGGSGFSGSHEDSPGVILTKPDLLTPHQDSTFLYTDPLNLVGVWIALEDADLGNGCLSFIPGSHKEGITRRMIRNPNGDQPRTIFTAPPDEYNDAKFIATPVKAGTCVIIHGEVVHKSEKNTSSRSRHIYTFHVIESKDTVWSKDNWLQPTPEHPFPLLYA